MKAYKFVILLAGLMLVSCQEKEKSGVLYLLNTSKCGSIELVSTSGESVIVDRGGYYHGFVYFAGIFGWWNDKYYSYSLMHCAVGEPQIASVILYNTEYVLNDSLANSFRNIRSYTKVVDEREEYFYEMDNEFVELVKHQPKKTPSSSSDTW